jgi:hypothetical protein
MNAPKTNLEKATNSLVAAVKALPQGERSIVFLGLSLVIIGCGMHMVALVYGAAGWSITMITVRNLFELVR